MIQSLYDILITRFDYFMTLLLQHIKISAISIIFAALIGFLLGLLISEIKKTAWPILAFTSFLYTIPSIALFGFLIAYSGIGETTAIIALTVYGLLPMVRNTYAGLTHIQDDYIKTATALGSHPFQTLYQIKIPLALPYIMAGFKNMVVMTIALAGIASFIGAGGLGDAIFTGITTNNKALIIVGSLLVSLLALISDFLLGILEKRIKSRMSGHSKKRHTVTSFIVSIALIISTLFFIYTPTHSYDLVIASKPQTEQYILAEIISLLIEDKTNYSVEHKQGIAGGTTNIHPAMLKGDIDMVSDYTGTGYLYVLKQPPIKDEARLYQILTTMYHDMFDMTWLSMYGFNNTYTLVVKEAIATRLNIKTFSDLAQHAHTLRLGAEFDFFEREDGYTNLNQLYGFNFGSFIKLDFGLKAAALKADEVDVLLAYTTDALLSESGLVVLEDDLHYFPNYYAGLVINNATLARYPDIKPILQLLEGRISNEQMAYMNYQVDVLGLSPLAVAEAFIEREGF